MQVESTKKSPATLLGSRFNWFAMASSYHVATPVADERRLTVPLRFLYLSPGDLTPAQDWSIGLLTIIQEKEKRMKAIEFVILGTLTVSLVACASESQRAAEEQRPAKKTSLYERLGGLPGITAVVDAFVGRVANDDRINDYFANADLPRLKSQLVDQICQASGGPCTYGGRSMKDAHKGMGVTNDAFDALVADLGATLDNFRVPTRDKNELLSVLAPMRSDIVERP
jgi:hemoglobin